MVLVATVSNTLTREQFKAKLEEYRDTCAVLLTGMPQATAHESKAAQARGKELELLLERSPWTEKEDGKIVYKKHSLRFLESMSNAARSPYQAAMNYFRDAALRREKG